MGARGLKGRPGFNERSKGEVRRNFVNGVLEDLTQGFEPFRRVRSN